MANSSHIINGPNKWDIAQSLFEAKKVSFKINGSGGTSVLEVRIDMLERECGSNERWNFSCSSPKMVGHYCTQSRTGTIKPA